MVDNHDEVRKSAMADKRTLASLFLHFQQQENEQASSTEDMGSMFRRETALVEVIRSMAREISSKD